VCCALLPFAVAQACRDCEPSFSADAPDALRAAWALVATEVSDICVGRVSVRPLDDAAARLRRPATIVVDSAWTSDERAFAALRHEACHVYELQKGLPGRDGLWADDPMRDPRSMHRLNETLALICEQGPLGVALSNAASPCLMTSPEDELRLAAVANEVFRVTPEALVAETVYFEEHPECAEFTASPLVRRQLGREPR
jgi:hypothetical protein